jgi:hypothetical protein
MSATTHPGYAALADPLSGYAAKRVLNLIIKISNYQLIKTKPLFPPKVKREWSGVASTG